MSEAASAMPETNWRSRLNNCNLNHLIVLEAVITARNVTRAASRLGMSQPAVSRVLKGLREILDDPILITDDSGTKLTPRAREIELHLTAWLHSAAEIIGTKTRNPAESDVEVRIATLDDCLVLFLKSIRRAVASSAPGIRLRFTSQWGSKFEEQDAGKVDFVIDIVPDVGVDFPTERLLTCEWVCVMRAGHPLSGAPLSLDGYLSQDHALVTTTDIGPALVDRAIPEGHPLRSVTLRLPYFASLPDVIEDSDLLTTMPIHLARKIFAERPVALRPLPVPMEKYSYALIWHDRSRRDPVRRFMVERIAESCRDFHVPPHPSEL